MEQDALRSRGRVHSLKDSRGHSHDAPPRRALLAWEFGAGRTHVRHLVGVARHLRAAGVECLATLYEMHLAPELEALGVPCVQNYVWPARRRAPLPWTERPARTLGDVMANLGVSATESLQAAIAHYDGLFSLFEPDLVLCENAPGAILAARGRRPVIAFGTAACLPPRQGESFAARPGGPDTPAWPVEAVLAGINAGLERAGRPPLAALGDLLRIEGVYPYGPAAFDIHADTRRDPVLPPAIDGLTRPVPLSEGEEVFVYLHGFVRHASAIMQALERLDRPVRAFIPGLSEAHRQLLAVQGIRIEREAVPVDEIVRRSRCVLHHGGQQMTTACLAAGLPQVVVPKEPDNLLCADFVMRNGLGRAIGLGEVTSGRLLGALREACGDDALRARCRAMAPTVAEWIAGDPASIVADAALAQIEGRRRAATVV